MHPVLKILLCACTIGCDTVLDGVVTKVMVWYHALSGVMCKVCRHQSDDGILEEARTTVAIRFHALGDTIFEGVDTTEWYHAPNLCTWKSSVVCPLMSNVQYCMYP